MQTGVPLSLVPAVADYKPTNFVDKIKKRGEDVFARTDSHARYSSRFRLAPDTGNSFSAVSLENRSRGRNAAKKRREKDCELIVAKTSSLEFGNESA